MIQLIFLHLSHYMIPLLGLQLYVHLIENGSSLGPLACWIGCRYAVMVRDPDESWENPGSDHHVAKKFIDDLVSFSLFPCFISQGFCEDLKGGKRTTNRPDLS